MGDDLTSRSIDQEFRTNMRVQNYEWKLIKLISARFSMETCLLLLVLTFAFMDK